MRPSSDICTPDRTRDAGRALLDLAPDRSLLALQHDADARAKLRKSQRAELDPCYIDRYMTEILDRELSRVRGPGAPRPYED